MTNLESVNKDFTVTVVRFCTFDLNNLSNRTKNTA